MDLLAIFAYAKSWFNSPSLTTAAENDLIFFKSPEKFRRVDRAVYGLSTGLVLVFYYINGGKNGGTVFGDTRYSEGQYWG